MDMDETRNGIPLPEIGAMTHWPEQPSPVPPIVETVRRYLQSGDYSPMHEPGMQPGDYLRELARNPDILAKNIEQGGQFNFGGTTKGRVPLLGIGMTAPLKGGELPLRDRIIDAYSKASGGKFGEHVKLSDIRQELSDVPREQVDAELLRILQGKEPAARLGQIADRKTLTKADREAVFNPGGDPFDLLWRAHE